MTRRAGESSVKKRKSEKACTMCMHMQCTCGARAVAHALCMRCMYSMHAVHVHVHVHVHVACACACACTACMRAGSVCACTSSPTRLPAHSGCARSTAASMTRLRWSAVSCSRETSPRPPATWYIYMYIYVGLGTQGGSMGSIGLQARADGVAAGEHGAAGSPSVTADGSEAPM